MPEKTDEKKFGEELEKFKKRTSQQKMKGGNYGEKNDI